MRDKPLLFLDVDGVLDRFASTPADLADAALGRVTTRCLTANGWQHTFVSERADTNRLRLLAASFDLVWATTMEHYANLLVSPLMGLDVLPAACEETGDGASKVPGLLRFAGQRPFAWVDDDVTDKEQAMITQRPVPSMVVVTDPRVGLTGSDVTQLLGWAAAVHRCR